MFYLYVTQITLPVQVIREQMMKSLEIIKDLEEQVKLVPMLKVIFLTETIINIVVKAVVGVEINFNEFFV